VGRGNPGERAQLEKERINVRSIYATTTAGRGSVVVALTAGGNPSKARS